MGQFGLFNFQSYVASPQTSMLAFSGNAVFSHTKESSQHRFHTKTPDTKKVFPVRTALTPLTILLARPSAPLLNQVGGTVGAY